MVRFVNESGRPGAGKLPDRFQPIDPGAGDVILSALYPEAGSVLARFYEYRGQDAETSLAYRGGKARLSTTERYNSTAFSCRTAQMFFRTS